MPNVKKIQLSNGQIYSIFDEGALRLDPSGKLITGNGIVDKIILQNAELYITAIDDVPIEEDITNVLVQDEVTKAIKRRSIDYLLKDIGGVSCEVEGKALELKIGK